MVVVDGDRAYVAGHGPVDGARVLAQGCVGEDLTVEAGYAAARDAALSIVASLERELGDLDRVARWLRATVYVNAAPRLAGPEVTLVANGFSDVVRAVWGGAGRHTRVSPGVASLPFDVPVVIEAPVAV